MRFGRLFDGRRRYAASSTSRAVGLCDDRDDAVDGREQTFESRNGEFRCSEEDGLYHFPDRRSFLIFRRIASRLNPRRWSRNREPSR